MTSIFGLAEKVGGTLDSYAGGIEDVGVDHGGGDVVVSEKFLDGADVCAALEEVGGNTRAIALWQNKGRTFVWPGRQPERSGENCGGVCAGWRVWRGQFCGQRFSLFAEGMFRECGGGV